MQNVYMTRVYPRKKNNFSKSILFTDSGLYHHKGKTDRSRNPFFLQTPGCITTKENCRVSKSILFTDSGLYHHKGKLSGLEVHSFYRLRVVSPQRKTVGLSFVSAVVNFTVGIPSMFDLCPRVLEACRWLT